MLNEPEIAYHGVVYVEHYGDAAYVARCRTVCQRNTGATLSPFNGFLLLQGVETMALRVERHVENARKVAEFLRDHPMVEWVNYAGFPDSPLYPMAQRYLGSKRCSLLTFGVKGGFEAGTKCFNALRLFKRMVNMGDAKSLACHPASTTHRQLVARRATEGRRDTGNDSPERRHRAHRRYYRRSRSGAGQARPEVTAVLAAGEVQHALDHEGGRVPPVGLRKRIRP